MTCPCCFYKDIGWESNLTYFQRKRILVADTVMSDDLLPYNLRKESISWEPYIIHISSFTDAGELGFHLRKIRETCAISPRVDIILDLTRLQYDWDYGADYDEETDLFLPPSVGILALLEVRRFIEAIHISLGEIVDLTAKLPDRAHPVCALIDESGIVDGIIKTHTSCDGNLLPINSFEGCQDVLVPVTVVGPETRGQLSGAFYQRFERLAQAGLISDTYRSAIRRVIMEVVENGEIYGKQCWVTCFLRQEKRPPRKRTHEKHLGHDFLPWLHTHLFINVFTIGPTLKEATGYSTEWEAAQAILRGFSSRPDGGTGIERVMSTVIRSAEGSLSINSGNYSCIMLPDGLIREHTSAGNDYLPGVHFCMLVPLATVLDMAKVKQLTGAVKQ